MLTFNLPNMTCGHCEKKVRETITSLDPAGPRPQK